MKTNKQLMRLLLVLALSLVLVAAGCGEAENDEPANENGNNNDVEANDGNNANNGDNNGAAGAVDGEEVELTFVAWDSEIASTNVIGQVLEEVGYDVELTQVDNTPMWQGVADGGADGMVAAWLPATHAEQYDRFADEVVDLGPNLEGAKIGMVVPEYVDIDSIAEVTEEEFEHITGIEAGAGVMNATEQAIEDYDLDLELTPSSSAGMVSELQTKYDNEEPIAITGWTPHWKFQSFDLKYLEDPEGSYGEAEDIHTMVREGLEEDLPQAYQVLDNFSWSTEDMEAVMLDIAENDMSAEEAAAAWIEDNRGTVDEWLEGIE